MKEEQSIEDLAALLPAQQREAAELLSRGYSVTRCAAQLDVARQTVSGWRNQNFDFKRYLTALQRELAEDAVAELTRLRRKAIEILDTAMDAGDGSSVEVAKFVARFLPLPREPKAAPRTVVVENIPEQDKWVKDILDSMGAWKS